MDTDNYLTRFFIDYQAVSETKLNREQFITLLTFFPTLLVVGADENIDDEEWIFVEHIAKAMADTFREELPDYNARMQLKEHFFADLKFLTEHMQAWKEPFLQTLKKYLQELPDIADEVLDVLYLFADASESTSEEEERVINNIREQLGI
ncbi:hypothetical protein [Rhodoflexus caldus]|uniref:hypothetical protein n=1 Tax=Rhodoflexus caldus TaxID=2891236 RepID=UPI00202A5084|nr:hypothetical protein [Rhodoflexus caldus]